MDTKSKRRWMEIKGQMMFIVCNRNFKFLYGKFYIFVNCF